MADKSCAEEREKSLYLAQIRYLDEQLERRQLQCDELKKKNKYLVTQSKAMEEETYDIAGYLKHCLDATDKRVEELTEELSSLQHIQKDREALKLQLGQQIQELQERLSELRQKQEAMTEELKEREMLLRQATKSVESMKEQLVRQEKENEAAIHSMKAKLDSDMEKMFGEMERTMAKDVDTQISNFFQEERARHREELEKMEPELRELRVLWEEKRNLQMSNETTCFDIKELEEDINKKREEWQTRMKSVQQLRSLRQKLEEKIKSFNTTNEDTRAKVEDLRQALASAYEERSQKTAEVSRLVAAGTEVRRKTRRLEAVWQDVAMIHRQILMDSESSASHPQWDMQDLLVVLESVTLDREAIEDEPTDPEFLLIRYRLGDFGFVPRPAWKPRRALSAATQRLLNSQKTLTSVDLAPPAPQCESSAPAPQQSDSEPGPSTSADC